MKITIDALIDGMVVEFDYHAPERQTWDEPGCDASVDVFSITVNGVDVWQLVESLNGIKRVEQLTLEAYEQQAKEQNDEFEIDRYEWSKSA